MTAQRSKQARRRRAALGCPEEEAVNPHQVARGKARHFVSAVPVEHPEHRRARIPFQAHPRQVRVLLPAQRRQLSAAERPAAVVRKEKKSACC